MIVTSPDNFELTAQKGYSVQGVKSRHRRKAERMRPGDFVLYYVTGEATFAAVCEITSPYFEDHERIWSTRGKPHEDYPWRVRIRAIHVPEPPDRVPAEELVDRLAFVKKWPAAHWRLAFQGNVHELPAADFDIISRSLHQGAGSGRSS